MDNSDAFMERLAKKALEYPTLGKRNMALFFAHKEPIQKALAQGWSVKLIWKTLHDEGAFPAGYEAFRHYVKKFIDKPDVLASPPKKTEDTEVKSKPGGLHHFVQSTEIKKEKLY